MVQTYSVDLRRELKTFEYREIFISPAQLFPQINIAKIKKDFSHLVSDDPHQTVFSVAKALWERDAGYDVYLKTYGFWDARFETFSGHCHQCTPALGVILYALGFEDVSYLECLRVRDHVWETGIVEKFPPHHEPEPMKIKEYCDLGRIPYCCLEVVIEERPFYVTGKHMRLEGKRAIATLDPLCYEDFIGVFPHQDDISKSGLYIKRIEPLLNLSNTDFSRQVVWRKQSKKDNQEEFFATFLRMKLEI